MSNLKCKICNSSNVEYRGKPRENTNFPITGSDYNIICCKDCVFYSLDRKIDVNQLQWKKLYETDYFANNNSTEWQQALHAKEVENRLNEIESCCPSERGNFLDLGCGQGLVLSAASERGFVSYGLDIADNVDKVARESAKDLFIGNLFEASYSDDFFSVIYIDSVLEHVDEPIALLQEVYRILAPGGVLFIVVPNENSLINDIRKLLYTLAFKSNKFGEIKPFVSPYHINGFTPSSLKYALECVQFNHLRSSQFSGNYHFWKGYKKFSKLYFLSLFLYPFRLFSILITRQEQLMVLYSK